MAVPHQNGSARERCREEGGKQRKEEGGDAHLAVAVQRHAESGRRRRRSARGSSLARGSSSRAKCSNTFTEVHRFNRWRGGLPVPLPNRSLAQASRGGVNGKVAASAWKGEGTVARQR